MAILAGASIPVAQGAIADRIGVHHPVVLAVIYCLQIAYYALPGLRPVRVE